MKIGGSGEGRARKRGRAEGNGNKSFFMRHKALSIVMSSVLLVLVVAGAFLFYYYNIYKHPEDVLVKNRTPLPQTTDQGVGDGTTGIVTTGGSGSPDMTAGVSPTPTDLQSNYTFPNDVVNILMLGTDTGLNRQGMGARTDCIMLISINVTTKKVSIISVPRDTYVKIYNEKMRIAGRNRINATFAYGGGADKKGIPYAKNTISHFLGNVPIDYYVVFDMDLVVRLIDMVGGVTVDVQLSEPFSFGNIHLEPGVHKLNAMEALTYARDRHHTAGSDFGRVGHQQQVLVAVLKELKNQGKISMIPQLYQALSNNVKTDMSMDVIVALASIAMDVDIDATMSNSHTITGSTMMIDGASIVIADQTQKIDVLKTVFGTNAGLYLKPYEDEKKSYLTGLINKQFKAGQVIVNNANALLNNNKEFYTDAEAAQLRAAIAAWNAAHSKNDSDGMAEAQQDVQTEYDILQDIVEARKAAAATPTPEPTIAESTSPPETTSTTDPSSTPS